MNATPYEEWGLWSFRSRFTAGGGAGQTVDVSAGAGNVIHVLQYRTAAVIAATGTLDIDLLDEDANIVVKLVDLAAAAAPIATVPRLNDDIVSSTNSLLAASVGGVWLAGTDLRLRSTPGTMAAADTLDVQIIARVLRGPGVLTAGADLTGAISVNEVY